MNALEALFTIIGAATVTACAVLGTLAWVGSAFHGRRSRWKHRDFESGMRHQRSLLLDDARWFSEDETTYWLLIELISGRRETGSLRREWRERRRAPNA